MQANRKAWTRVCIHCQRAKVLRHVSSSLTDFVPPSSSFELVHMDIVAPLPSLQGYRYCLTCVDRFPRWPEAIPIKNIEATTIAKAFLSDWIARFSTPLRITRDQGRQFESHMFRELNNLLGSQHLRTTVYYLASNGLVQRMHRQFKTAIKCHEAEKSTEILLIVLPRIRTQYNIS